MHQACAHKTRLICLQSKIIIVLCTEAWCINISSSPLLFLLLLLLMSLILMAAVAVWWHASKQASKAIEQNPAQYCCLTSTHERDGNTKYTLGEP